MQIMINKETIQKWWNIFVGDGRFTEVRILGKFTYSGYFKSVDNLVSQIEPYSNMEDEQIYFTLNTIDPACYGRQQSEKIVKSPKITTNDNDIIHRDWVMCDFDPIRKSGTNASEEEFELAHQKAQEVFRFLRDKGFEAPVICKSGNGWHLLYKIDVNVSDEATETIKGFFKYMGMKFSDDRVEFDEKNFNAARVCKLYGTMAKKGANLQDRPWRMSEIVYSPAEIKVTPLEKFKELADLLPKEEPKSVPNRNFRNQLSTNSPFDLVTWLNAHGVVYREKKTGASTLYELEYCPWVDTHSDKKKWDSALFQDADGKITFNCTHSHCKGKTWQDVRLFYEPDAYDKPQWQPQPHRQYQPMRPKYEIKGEIPELGKKWLTMSSIKKVDLSKIDGVKTGVVELDRSIVKLHYGEVTVLSGGNASGKSSFLNTLILNIANQGVPSALWSGELPEPILKAWIQMVAAGKNNLRMSQFGDGKFFVPQNIGDQIDKWLDNLLFIYNTEYGNQWEQLLADMDVMYNAGIKVFILDNLMAMNIDLLEGDKNNKQKTVILKVKEFAKKKNVHVILVAHPRKSMAFLRKNDISGTADLTNAVDNIFIMHRVNNDFLRQGEEFFGKGNMKQFDGFGNVIEVCKNRMYGIVDLFVGMHYELESRRFKNTIDENVKYGWELPPKQNTFNYQEDRCANYEGDEPDSQELDPLGLPITGNAPF